MKVNPVIHVTSKRQAVEQAGIAADAGSDGVFLIDHEQHSIDLLIDAFEGVTKEFKELRVGLNYLCFDPLSGYEFTKKLKDSGHLPKLPDSLWFDDAVAGLESDIDTQDYLINLNEYRKRNPDLRNIDFYGGLAFKYTLGYSDNPAEAGETASRLAKYIDVVTTSGQGTNIAPSPEKIAAMKKGVGAGKLAIASGVSIDNIDEFMPFTDEILVASSVETFPYSGEFVPEFVADIVLKAHQGNK